MTKSEYMKKLSYSLRRLPKEDFNQAIDYFEEYFAEAGEVCLQACFLRRLRWRELR